MVKIVLLDNNAIFIENYNNIDYFDDLTIRIICKGLIIIITGTNLKLASFNKLSLKISGIISNIEYINS